ncbi:transcriptional activator ampR family protein [Xanthomonas arboricola pv. fragariae]|nr:transcriptional activator ampR family protein [Xanthomonas arboricola pv. fragariae]
MPRPRLPLNALRAFEAAARHQNLTRAASELCVSQAALSHQIKALEQQLRTSLFHRLPRGVALTDEGAALAPVLGEAFDRIAATLERFADGRYREVLSVGVVGTFATGWLLPRVDAFHAAHPQIELRLSTHNNRVDLAGEGLDLAIRFGDGDWQGQIAEALMEAPFAPVCAPSMARGLRTPADLAGMPLLRSYRLDEWPQWFRAAGMTEIAARGDVRFVVDPGKRRGGRCRRGVVAVADVSPGPGCRAPGVPVPDPDRRRTLLADAAALAAGRRRRAQLSPLASANHFRMSGPAAPVPSGPAPKAARRHTRYWPPVLEMKEVMKTNSCNSFIPGK